MYNALGRNGGQEATGNSDNFFVKRGKSIENAVGTTLAAPISFANDRIHQMGTEQLLKDNQTKMQDIVKKYGYSSLDDYYDALDAAEAKEDKTEYNNFMNTIQKELQDQANANVDAMKQRQTDYEDYRNNNYISQKINQDPGKFAGSAINTLSTMADVMLPAAGIAFNAAQGVAEGYADELEQNGFQNFDWNRANQNALIGGVTGGVTGAFNKGLSNSLAKNGGNLFKGGNRLTNWMNETGAKHPIMATLATGAGRGALSGAVGGATGGGLSAQLNGGNFLEGAARGAVQGAQSGAVTGATMAGANMALNATPGVGKVMRNLNQAGEEWKKSGSNFNERLTNTLTSGDSVVGDWLMNKRQSRMLGAAGSLGNRIQDVSDTYRTVDTLGNRREYTPDEVRQLINEYENYKAPDVLSGNSTDEVMDAMGEAGVTLSEIFRNRNGGQFDPYNRADGEAFNKWVQQTKADLSTPTTATSDNVRNRALSNSKTEGYYEIAGDDPISDRIKQNVVQAIAEIDPEATMDDPYRSGWDLVEKSDTINDLRANLQKEWGGFLGNKDIDKLLGADTFVTEMQTPTATNKLSNRVKDESGRSRLRWGDEAEYGDYKLFDDENFKHGYFNDTPSKSRAAEYNEAAKFVTDIVTGKYKGVPDDVLLGKFATLSAGAQNDVMNLGRASFSNDFMNQLSDTIDPYPRLLHQVNTGEISLSEVPKQYRSQISQDVEYLQRQNATPTTAKGWLKKAGERIVEDINDRGAGLSIKKIDDGLPDDVRGMQINDYNTDNTEEYIPTKATDIQPTQAKTTVQPTQYDAWDRLAQEYGYETYDDVISDYMASNPNAKINQRGMAGQILGWLDNQQTPTTVGGWAKKAGGRVLDEINQRGAGLSIKDVDETPETEVYRTFNEDTENMVDIPQKPTGEQIKNKRLLVQEIQSQFNTVDTPTARGTKPNETFYNLYEDYGLSDGDDIRQAVAYAEPGSLLPQMISEAAGEAGIIDLSDAQALVMDLKLNKKQNYARTLGALEDLMDSTETTIIGGKAGVDALQFQRALEQAASDARGSNGTYHIGKNLVDETMAKNFDRIARNIGEKLDNAAVQKGAVQNVVNRHAADLQAMRNAFPNNTKWQENFVDKVANAQKISDLRHSIRDLTRANIYIRNGDEKFSTVGSTVARSGGRGISTDIPTTKGTLINRGVNYIADKIYNTDAARNARLEKYDQKIKGGDTVANTNNTSTSVFNALKGRIGGGTPTGTTTAQTQQMSNRSTLPTQIYNAIGRTEGATNAEQTRTANYLANAVQNANTLEDLASAGYTDPSMSVYNAVYGEPTSTSGDYWSSILSNAMKSAMDAGDADSFAKLYSMYQDAVGSQAKTTTNKLTDKQRQANAAARALADFEQVTPNFGYDVSDIPVIGNIANWGGNEYLSKAEALALQIGYMLSGATVNKDEARKIGMSYIPQPRDSEAVRKSKLAQLRGIISDYQQTYAE
jgi:hypothetical protein